jgi:hypothetical protein
MSSSSASTTRPSTGTSNGTGDVADFTLAELRNLDFSS